MGNKRFILGFDIGSSGCKASLIDIESHKIITISEEITTYYPNPGWAEQEPEEWISKAAILFSKVMKKASCQPGDIAVIGLSGVTHSLIMMDGKYNLLGRNIHITDGRSHKQTQELKERAGKLILNTALNPVDVIWTISMLAWVRENDKNRWDKISSILFPKDYIRFRLTGSKVTDTVDAQGTLLFDPVKKKWDPALIDLIELDASVLPDLADPSEIVGQISSEGAKWSGLKKGTPVIAGTTDTLLEVYAAGSRNLGDCTVKLATFGRICVITDKPFYGEGMINYSYIFPGKWYPGTGTRSCGTSLRWSRDQFFKDLDKENAYSIIDKEAEKIPVGSQGLIFHPYLQGEGSPYDDPLLRGDFIGITLHHTRDHMARSIMEGVSFSLLDSLEYIKEKGIAVKPPLRCIGGGSKSRLWTEILTDVLGYDIVVPTITDASVGAALIAGVGIGIFKDYREAQEFNYGIFNEISYEKNRNLKYRDIFSIYKEAKKKLESINHQLATSFEIQK